MARPGRKGGTPHVFSRRESYLRLQLQLPTSTTATTSIYNCSYNIKPRLRKRLQLQLQLQLRIQLQLQLRLQLRTQLLLQLQLQLRIQLFNNRKAAVASARSLSAVDRTRFSAKSGRGKNKHQNHRLHGFCCCVFLFPSSLWGEFEVPRNKTTSALKRGQRRKHNNYYQLQKNTRRLLAATHSKKEIMRSLLF